MISPKLQDVNIISARPLPTPEKVKSEYPTTEKAGNSVISSRQTIRDILDGTDQRLLAIAGPCSIHDVDAGLDYAQRFAVLAEELSDVMFFVMRVYFCKPRTTIGWKGLINDPRLDGSFQVCEGLKLARRFLIDLAELGVPTGTEVMDPIIPQYIDDLIAWYAIGARTAESQFHREIASGLSAPVGIKNGTDGNIAVAINALTTMRQQHSFLGIDQRGQVAVLDTTGITSGHLILRGGGRPNYDPSSVRASRQALAAANLPENIVIDCSHGNSEKDHRNQPRVLEACIQQVEAGDDSLVGVMLESNIHEGNQSMSDIEALRYGVSVTDACICWKVTERILREAAGHLRETKACLRCPSGPQ
jgi:3-deoxy-7-phosphoheptulonate synthase